MQLQQLTYAVDLVFCVDATGSMAGLIDKVKQAALGFHGLLTEAMSRKGKHVDALRIRVVSFRDFFADGEAGFAASPFFSLPAEEADFSAFVSALRADGGGDEPESALEALATALSSEWTRAGARRRHIVVMYTDASAHPLERGATEQPTGYPTDLPRSFDALTDLWEGQRMSVGAKRLLLFAPDAAPWSDVQAHWSNVIHFPSRAGEGLDEVDRDAILDAIANSV